MANSYLSQSWACFKETSKSRFHLVFHSNELTENKWYWQKHNLTNWNEITSYWITLSCDDGDRGANTESWLFCRCQKACNRTADELVIWIKNGYDGSSRPNKTGKNTFVYSFIHSSIQWVSQSFFHFDLFIHSTALSYMYCSLISIFVSIVRLL